MKKSLFVLLFVLLGMSQTNYAQDGFIGEIRMFAGNFAPRGWAFCNGQLLSIAQNQALFSILGTTYGGDGRTTFALPDLRGRAPVQAGTGPGLSNYDLGETGGAESIHLNPNQVPTSTPPTLRASTEGGNTDDPTNAVLAKPKNKLKIYYSGDPNNSMRPNAISAPASGGQPVDIRQPYLGVNFIICMQGIFPSRN